MSFDPSIRSLPHHMRGREQEVEEVSTNNRRKKPNSLPSQQIKHISLPNLDLTARQFEVLSGSSSSSSSSSSTTQPASLLSDIFARNYPHPPSSPRSPKLSAKQKILPPPLPLPDFDRMTTDSSSPSSPKNRVPSPPRKTRQPHDKDATKKIVGADHPYYPFIQKSLEIGQNKQITDSDKAHFTLEEMPGASGDYNQIYKVTGSTPLIPNYSNDQIIIRLFKEEILARGVKEVASSLSNLIRNNIELQLANIPTLPFLNGPTLLQDGYIAVPYVPHAFTLTENNQSSLLFALQTCYAYDICADAHHGTSTKKYKDTNWRSFEQNGQPVLCDWMELPPEKFSVRIPSILRSFVKQPNDLVQPNSHQQKILNALDPRILTIEWDRNTDLRGLTAHNLSALFTHIATTKKNLVDSIFQGQITIEEARKNFNESVASKQFELRLNSVSLCTLRNLYELKNSHCSSFLVSQYRSGNHVYPISKEAIINGNEYVRELLENN